MRCRDIGLSKHSPGVEEIKLLRCDTWGCEFCTPGKRRDLISLAARGEPNKLFTITAKPKAGESANERADRLKKAVSKLRKRILTQLRREPGDRWPITDDRRSPKVKYRDRVIVARTPASKKPRWPYAWFMEATKRGEPHLHLLLRCEYIPQAWLSEQLDNLVGAKITDIRQIPNTRVAVRYVTKYIGKEPAQFGSGNRYFASRDWDLAPPQPDERRGEDDGFVFMGAHISVAQHVHTRLMQGAAISRRGDNELAIYDRAKVAGMCTGPPGSWCYGVQI